MYNNYEYENGVLNLLEVKRNMPETEQRVMS